MKKIIFFLIALPFVFSCGKSNDGPSTSCSYDACATKAPASEIASVQSYLTSNNITATQHCSGMFYAIDQPGTGTTPTVCNSVTVTYKGQLTNGNVFDQSAAPITFALSQLINGFKNGIPLIKAGGKIRLYVPPSLGYGSSQAGTIPPNSILIFNVELISVQ